MQELPAFKVTPGLAASYEFTWTGYDLSGETITAEAWDRSDVALTAPTCTGDADGLVTVTLSATDTADYPSRDVPGFFLAGGFKVTVGALEIFRGPLFTAGGI